MQETLTRALQLGEDLSSFKLVTDHLQVRLNAANKTGALEEEELGGKETREDETSYYTNSMIHNLHHKFMAFIISGSGRDARRRGGGEVGTARCTDRTARNINHVNKRGANTDRAAELVQENIQLGLRETEEGDASSLLFKQTEKTSRDRQTHNRPTSIM